MWFKHKAWIPIAWLLSLANLGAVWFAARPGETWHATAHALLAVLFGLGAQRLSLRKHSTADTSVADRVQQLEARLGGNPESRQLAQAVDAVALEVERIGEGQRYLTKIFAERDARPAGEKDPVPIPPPTRPAG